jgi:hypothetical protein
MAKMAKVVNTEQFGENEKNWKMTEIGNSMK